MYSVIQEKKKKNCERVCKLRRIKSQERSWAGKGEGNGTSRVNRELKWNSKRRIEKGQERGCKGLKKEKTNRQREGGKEWLKESETKRRSVRSEKNWRERKSKRTKRKKNRRRKKWKRMKRYLNITDRIEFEESKSVFVHGLMTATFLYQNSIRIWKM